MTEVVVTVDVPVPQVRFTLIGEWSFPQCGQHRRGRRIGNSGCGARTGAQVPVSQVRRLICHRRLINGRSQPTMTVAVTKR